MMLDYTFGMIKAPSVARGHADNILTNISRRGYSILWAKRWDFTEETLRAFYSEHVGHPYWHNVERVMMNPAGNVAFIAQLTSSPAGKWHTIAAFRGDIGSSSNPGICSPTSLRGIYGGCWWGGDPLVYADNAIHGSDSVESVLREVGIIYPEGIDNHG